VTGGRRRVTVHASDPRHVGAATATVGTAVDTRHGILVDSLNAARVAHGTRGQLVYALQLGGRVNQSTDRVSVLHLLDADGLAAIVGEAVLLAQRDGDGPLAAAMLANIDELRGQGELP
jgi:hypothetical protein